jgi:hypothetical protein
MQIEWARVTWYSQVFAIGVLVTAFLLGIRIGQFKARVNAQVDLMIQASNSWMDASTSSSLSNKIGF